jgi:hypothetical protein
LNNGVNVGASFVTCSAAGLVVSRGLLEFEFEVFVLAVFAVLAAPPQPNAIRETRSKPTKQMERECMIYEASCQIEVKSIIN